MIVLYETYLVVRCHFALECLDRCTSAAETPCPPALLVFVRRDEGYVGDRKPLSACMHINVGMNEPISLPMLVNNLVVMQERRVDCSLLIH